MGCAQQRQKHSLSGTSERSSEEDGGQKKRHKEDRAPAGMVRKRRKKDRQAGKEIILFAFMLLRGPSQIPIAVFIGRLINQSIFAPLNWF